MARRSRYRGGGPYRGVYKARTAADVGRRPVARKVKAPRSRALPAPSSKAAARMLPWAMTRTYGAQPKWPAEARLLKRGALYDALGNREYAGYGALWREYQADVYRRLYNAQQRTRRAAAPKRRSPWIRVRAHRRHRAA
jgi:hypothetical protein